MSGRGGAGGGRGGNRSSTSPGPRTPASGFSSLRGPPVAWPGTALLQFAGWVLGGDGWWALPASPSHTSSLVPRALELRAALALLATAVEAEGGVPSLLTGTSRPASVPPSSTALRTSVSFAQPAGPSAATGASTATTTGASTATATGAGVPERGRVVQPAASTAGNSGPRTRSVTPTRDRSGGVRNEVFPVMPSLESRPRARSASASASSGNRVPFSKSAASSVPSVPPAPAVPGVTDGGVVPKEVGLGGKALALAGPDAAVQLLRGAHTVMASQQSRVLELEAQVLSWGWGGGGQPAILRRCYHCGMFVCACSLHVSSAC